MAQTHSKPAIVDPDDITPDWLTQVFAAGGVDATVKAFTAKRVGTGQIGDSIRFTLDFARATPDAPRSIVGKFPSAGEQSRATGVALGNYLREVNFYRELAPTALVKTPRCYFTDIDPGTHAFVLMMEDLAPAEQGDQLRGVSLETTRLVLEQAARLHASHWGDDRIDDLAWVQGTRNAPSAVSPEMVAGLWTGFVHRYGPRVTPLARRIGDVVSQNWGRVNESRAPRCLTHNDFRPDNMMFATPAGGYPVTVLDWQSVGYGPGATDVAYFLAGALPRDVRREHEDALLDTYLGHLRALGVRDYAREDLGRDYAAGSFLLFITAFFAAMVVNQTARGDDMFFVMLDGAAAQIEDVGALDLLG